MTDAQIPNGVILFGYPQSPYTHRIEWYLALRNISYATCVQPRILPRPDLTALGIRYRRIPLLAIGRDVYADTRLILRVLDERFPNTLGGHATVETGAASVPRPLKRDPLLAELFSMYSMEGGLFQTTVALLPASGPMFKSESFVKDRNDLMRGFDDMAARNARMPHALASMRIVFTQLEEALSDGRMWLAGSQELGAEDLNAVYPLAWAATIPGTLDEKLLGSAAFPKVHAWMARVHEAVGKAQSRLKPIQISGQQAVSHVKSRRVAENPADTEIVDGDPLGLELGDLVRVWPTDYGSRHKDQGKLVGLKLDEIVIEVSAADGTPVRLHTPRRGFRVAKADEPEKSSL